MDPKSPSSSWRIAPHHPRESERIEALNEADLAGELPDELHESVVRLASRLCGTPMSLVSLVGSDKQWFTGVTGLNIRESPRDIAFCSHTILQDDPLIVPDAIEDDRFAGNPLVICEPSIRFYAGVPLVTEDRLPLGSLCVLDTQPRYLSADQLDGLRTLAALVAAHIDMRRRNKRLIEAEGSASKVADRFTKVASRVPGMIYQFRMKPDGSSAFPYASDGIRTIYGVTPEQVRLDASPLFNMVHPQDLPELVASIHESRRTLNEWKFEYRVCFPDGRIEWRLGKSMPEREPDGSTLWHGYVTDINATKLAQAQLKQMTDRFQLAAQAGGVGTWDWNIESNQLIWDEQMYRIYRIPANGSMRGFSQWCATKHPDDRVRCDRDIELALTGQKPFDTQFRILWPDGSIRMIRAIASVHRDPSGKPIRMIGTNWDVTAETQAAEELRHAQQLAETAHQASREIADRFTKLASRVPGMIYQFRMRPDGSTCFPYASEKIEQIYGVTPEEVRHDASAVFKILHPDDLPSIIESIHESARTLQEWKAEYRVRLDDGTERWLIGSSVPEREADGGTIWHGHIFDITDNKRMHAKLMAIAHDATAKANRLAEIARRTSNGVIITDCDERIEWVNEAFTQMTGFSPEELIGKTPAALLQGPATDRSELARIRNAIRSKTPVRAQIVNYSKSRVPYTVELEIVPLHDQSGTHVGFMSIESDVTERVNTQTELIAAQAKAEAANLAKSAFLANMSHEIRTPLTAILGFADLLRDDTELTTNPERRIQVIDTIRSAGAHLLTLINDILDLSKIEADKMSVERITVPLSEILDEVHSLLSPKASGKGVELTVSFASPVPDRIIGDPTRLRQILMNLVGNAVKFTEEGSVAIQISASGSSPNANLCIDVIDTGSGMTLEQSQRLFQAFAQADASVTRKHGGSGLGLMVSRRLANLMGGDVSLLHTELGKGSAFRLTLPLEASPDAKPLDHLTHHEKRPTAECTDIRLAGRILLAKDGTDNQRLIAFHLRKAGATVDVADNGRSALELLNHAVSSSSPYDLVLTDIHMPEMDGYTLTRTLRAQGTSIPIIALTAHAMPEDRQKCLQAGCDDYATKPIDKVNLLTTCSKWIARKSPDPTGPSNQS